MKKATASFRGENRGWPEDAQSLADGADLRCENYYGEGIHKRPQLTDGAKYVL